MERIQESFRVRRFGIGVLLSVGVFNLGTHDAHAYGGSETSRQTLDKPSRDWDLQTRDTFNDDVIGSYWETMDDDSFPWDRFSQYRQFAVKERGGKLVLTTRRHCLNPDEEMTLANAQTEPCAPGETESYSAGRVEGLHDIQGDFKVTVKARMPLGRVGTREAIWMNNLQEMGQPNGGYCIEGSIEPNNEKDLVENYGDRRVRASHHMYCRDGEMSEVPRTARLSKKERSKFNEYTVVHIGNKTEFFVNDRPVSLLKNKKKSIDTPRDFEDVSRSEYRATQQYLEGLIFCTRAFDDPAASSKLFRAPDPAKPFPARHMKIDDVSVYALDH